ncbi:MAG: RHS repeat domain-containing protein [Limisphaerales bacterium]
MTDSGDGDGRLVDEVRNTFAWDDNSRLTSRVDNKGNATTTVFDALDRDVRTTFADGTSRAFVYDAHGNRVVAIEPNGTRQDAVYDLLNRRIRCQYTPGTGVLADTTFEEFDFDGLSRLGRADNDASSLSRGHDSLGRVTRETQGDAEVHTLYDGVGNPVLCIHPSGRIVTNAFDRLERLARVSDAVGLLGQYAYRGPVIARKDLGNGTRQGFRHDRLRRVTEIIHDVAPFDAASRFEHLVMEWGPTSHRTARDRVLPGGERRRFTYDSLDRLVESVRTPATGPAETTRYSLDGVGNRTQVAGGTLPGAYTLSASVPPADAQVNQYTSTPFGPRQHDDNGNLLAGGFGAESLGYDVHNRLVRYQGANGLMTYVYDALGRRIGKRAAPPATDETRFLYRGARVIEERDAQNRTTASYAYGANLDERLAMDRNGARYFYHADDLLNVTQVTDAQGRVVEEYRYDDYGSPAILAPDGTVRAESAIGNPYLFTGRYLDPESGLYHFRARYLDPAAGRFITRDPLGVWGDPLNLGNAYTYAASSPWTLTDPTGTEVITTTVVATAAGAAAYYYYEVPYTPPGSSGPQVSVQYQGNQVNIRSQVHGQTLGPSELAELARIIGEYEKFVKDPKNKDIFCQAAASGISTKIPANTPLDHFNIVHEVKPASDGATFGGHDYAVVRRGDTPLFVLDPIAVKNSGQGNLSPNNTWVWTYGEHQSTIQSRFGSTPSFIQNNK